MHRHFLLLLFVACSGCCTRTFSREELNEWNPSKIDMQRDKPASKEIEDFREGLWKGYYNDLAHKTLRELFITISRKDTSITGEFRIVNSWQHGETIYGGHVRGTVGTGKISFVATITNDSGTYPLDFTGEWLTDTDGMQGMYGTIKDKGVRFSLGGTWMAWHQND